MERLFFAEIKDASQTWTEYKINDLGVKTMQVRFAVPTPSTGYAISLNTIVKITQ